MFLDIFQNIGLIVLVNTQINLRNVGCSCSVLIVTLCALVLFLRNQSHERQLDGVKRDIHDAMHWAYSTSEDAIIKTDRAIKEWVQKLRSQH
jgi:hypothetical protein